MSSKKPDGDDDWSLESHLDSEAEGIWELIGEEVNNPDLIGRLGFADKKSVKGVIVLLWAPDGLHPTKGPDFLGPDWMHLDEAVLRRAIYGRNSAGNAITREVMKSLKGGDYERACQIARGSKYQVVYLSRTKEETRNDLQAINDSGVPVGEFGDALLERVGDQLLVGFHDNYSCFIRDD